jgi:hypothetical protein
MFDKQNENNREIKCLKNNSMDTFKARLKKRKISEQRDE